MTKRNINFEGKDDQEILELRDRVFEAERGGAERKIAVSAFVAEQNNQERMDLVTGAVNRDFWTCDSFADFVAGTALCDPRSAGAE